MLTTNKQPLLYTKYHHPIVEKLGPDAENWIKGHRHHINTKSKHKYCLDGACYWAAQNLGKPHLYEVFKKEVENIIAETWGKKDIITFNDEYMTGRDHIRLIINKLSRRIYRWEKFTCSPTEIESC